MKKSLIALAVAGAFAAPAFAATSNVDVYGVMNIAIQDTDAAGTSMTILDNTSRVGVKGSEDLGGGLKALWQIESALGGNGAVMGNVGTSGLATRNTFVGLAGGFGTVLAGRHDTPYKLGTGSLDIFGDTIADYNLGRLGQSLVNNTHDHRNGQALAYISPTWSGFHFAVAAVLTNGEAGSALSNGDNVDATSMTGVYVNGPLFASLSYQDAKALSNSATKIGLGYKVGDANLGLVYERTNDETVADADTNAWLINGVYNMGAIGLKAQYGKNNNAAGADGSAWALGVDYNLSKRTTAYAVYGNGDNGATDVSGWNLGVKHSF